MKVTTILTAAACLAGSFSLYADPAADREEAASSTGAYSVAGALRLPENRTKRDVYGMNVGWKLFKGKNAPEPSRFRGKGQKSMARRWARSLSSSSIRPPDT